MSVDELMWVISDALGCARRPALLDDQCDYCSLHGDDWPCEEPHRIALALAPLVEAREREARAEAWDDGFNAATDVVPEDVWFGPWSRTRNPYRDEESDA